VFPITRIHLWDQYGMTERMLEYAVVAYNPKWKDTSHETQSGSGHIFHGDAAIHMQISHADTDTPCVMM